MTPTAMFDKFCEGRSMTRSELNTFSSILLASTAIYWKQFSQMNSVDGNCGCANNNVDSAFSGMHGLEV